VAQLSRGTETIAPIQVAKPMPIKLQPPTPRLSAPVSPRGMRGPFN